MLEPGNRADSSAGSPEESQVRARAGDTPDPPGPDQTATIPRIPKMTMEIAAAVKA